MVAARHARDACPHEDAPCQACLTPYVEAREVIARHNYRLVWGIAGRFWSSTLTREDFFGAGVEGLLHALDLFQPRHGCRVSTYATWWCRQSMQRFSSTAGEIIRIPDNISRAHYRALRQGDDAPLPMTCHSVNGARFTDEAGNPSSIEEVTSAPEPSPEDVASDRERSAFAVALLEWLPPRERLILCRRYGLCGYAPVSLREIGAGLRLTKERVRQLESRALARLRKVGARQL